jgi:hypothetical protein
LYRCANCKFEDNIEIKFLLYILEKWLTGPLLIVDPDIQYRNLFGLIRKKI